MNKYNEAGLIEALAKQLESGFDHVDQSTFEWDHMWNMLWSLTGAVTYTREGLPIQDRAELNTQYNEVWQYMGSSKGYVENRSDARRFSYNAQNLWLEIVEPANWWMHSFRHRMHPRTQKREYVYLPASRAFMHFKTNNIPMLQGKVESIDLS